MEVPQFSAGWLARFKKRYGIRQRVRYGEAGSLDHALIAEQLVAVQAIARNFHTSDIYNCDETALFWKAMPDRGLSTSQLPGTKQHKARITAHFCCNADGSDKLPVWFIGKAKRPRAFGAANVHFNALRRFWRNNGTAWMTTPIVAEWLRWFDNYVAGRKVLLLLDNFAAHTAAVDAIQLLGQPLQNTVICWLPPNSTLAHQPLDQGIIKAWKAHYRKRWLLYVVNEFENNRSPLRTMNVLKAVRWSIHAWQQVSSETITNCWHHLKLLPTPS